MSCETWEPMIALDAGGDLPTDDAEGLAQHLATCDACRHFAEEMRLSQRAVGLLAGVSIDEKTLAAVRTQVLNEVSKQSAVVPLRLPPTVLALAASLAIALGALLLLRFSWPSPEMSANPSAALEEGPTERERSEHPPKGRTTEHSRPSVAETLTTPPPPDLEQITAETEMVIPPADDTPRFPTQPADRVAAIRAPVEETTQKTLKPRPSDTVPPPISEPMIIKLVSDEADLVIYWLINSPETTTPNDATKEIDNEISAV